MRSSFSQLLDYRYTASTIWEQYIFIIILDCEIKNFPLTEWKFHLITKDEQI